MDISTITASGTKMTTFYNNSRVSAEENESSIISDNKKYKNKRIIRQKLNKEIFMPVSISA